MKTKNHCNIHHIPKQFDGNCLNCMVDPICNLFICDIFYLNITEKQNDLITSKKNKSKIILPSENGEMEGYITHVNPGTYEIYSIMPYTEQVMMYYGEIESISGILFNSCVGVNSNDDKIISPLNKKVIENSMIIQSTFYYPFMGFNIIIENLECKITFKRNNV